MILALRLCSAGVPCAHRLLGQAEAAPSSHPLPSWLTRQLLCWSQTSACSKWKEISRGLFSEKTAQTKNFLEEPWAGFGTSVSLWGRGRGWLGRRQHRKGKGQRLFQGSLIFSHRVTDGFVFGCMVWKQGKHSSNCLNGFSSGALQGKSWLCRVSDFSREIFLCGSAVSCTWELETWKSSEWNSWNPLPSQTRAGSGRYLSYLAIISAQQWQKWQGTKELLMLTLNKLIKRDGQQPEEMNWAQFVKGIAASQCECCLSASFASLLPKSTPAVLQRSETTLQVRWYTFLIRFSLCSLQ